MFEHNATTPIENAAAEEAVSPTADSSSPELPVTSERERAALARLREALLATEPAIDPELVRGETLEEIDASFKAARAAVARIREAVRMEQAASIPAGAPGRTVPGPATALEKIKAGLADR